MMRLTVPEAIIAKLDEIDDAERRQREAQRRAQEREYERRSAIDRLRLERRDELAKTADAVFAWREAFVETEVSRRIWEAIGPSARLQLFVARFWKGEPVPETDVTVCAVLAFEEWRPGSFGLPPFWYEERFKGHVSSQTRIISPQGLIDAVHPDFLARAAAHFVGPDAWRYVLLQLDRHLPR